MVNELQLPLEVFVNTLKQISLSLFTLSVFALSQSAFATQTPFSKMDAKLKAELVKVMADVLPPYIEATEGVLNEIDLLPPGTVADSTELDELPISGLFEKHAIALDKSKFLGDRDFAGGRADHDVAWLRKSLVDLKALENYVAQTSMGVNMDVLIDSYVTVLQYQYKGPTEHHYLAIVEPVSRFYCNLQFNVDRNPGDAAVDVTAEETCD